MRSVILFLLGFLINSLGQGFLLKFHFYKIKKMGKHYFYQMSIKKPQEGLRKMHIDFQKSPQKNRLFEAFTQ